MKTILRLAAMLLVAFIIFSCRNEKTEGKDPPILSEKVTACYDETKAADPWEKGRVNDSTLVNNVKLFLLSDTITAYKVTICLDGQFDPCKSTFCKTGRRIKALIKRTDLVKIQKIRFYECN